jgi:hypothetical protein
VGIIAVGRVAGGQSFNDSKRTVIRFIYFSSMFSNVYPSRPDLTEVHAYLLDHSEECFSNIN